MEVNDSAGRKNYFRYDATISRDYYHAIAILEKMQAARRREEERQAPEQADPAPPPSQAPKAKAVNSIGFVSYPPASASHELEDAWNEREQRTDPSPLA